MTEDNIQPISGNQSSKSYRFLDLILVLVLIASALLRFVGISTWDEDQHLHPDERFLTFVQVDTSLPKNLAEYFNTETSLLNPHNVGHSFFVYGDFPITLVRYLSEWLNQRDYSTVNILGRQVSAIFDLATVLITYLIGWKLKDRRVGIAAALFYGLSVVPIQLSHFYTVDTFANFFVSLALLAAVCLYRKLESDTLRLGENGEIGETILPGVWSGLGYYLLFGFAAAMAMASKLSTAPLVLILPVAVGSWYIRRSPEEQREYFWVAIKNLAIAGAFAFLIFRIAQPYAFTGPGFFGIKPNPKLVENFTELRHLTNGDADFPPSLQWARRPRSFAWDNLFQWGMGWPLGILSWVGLIWVGINLLKKEWSRYIAVWTWTLAYFVWQAMSFNPMMRYTMLAYPGLCVMGALLIWALWDRRKFDKPVAWTRVISTILFVVTLIGTAAWAYAFTRIYTQSHPRIQAARWIYQNVPGPVNLHIETPNGQYHQPLTYPQGTLLTSQSPVMYDFEAKASGDLTEVYLFRVLDQTGSGEPKTLRIAIDQVEPEKPLGVTSLESSFGAGIDSRGNEYTAVFANPIALEKDHRYRITLSMSVGEGLLAFSGSAPANETDWDDGLPLRIDNYDGYAGIYTNGLNFQMYWDDNAEKYDRFVTTLDQADYIFISSNRQWATTTRVPERYPLTTAFYRALLGCPDGKDVIWCYQVAEPEAFKGTLGFDLIKTFHSDPTIGSIRINDQPAEESFTVYDHPKVFIFKKSAGYNPTAVRQLLAAVDLTQIIHTPLNEVPLRPQSLLLPAQTWQLQQQTNTWAELYPGALIYNQYPGLAAVIWYLVVLLLGLVMTPTVYLVFSGFKERGYALGRAVGMLLLALIVWWLGSVGVSFNRLTITLVLAGIILLNGFLAYKLRSELSDYVKSHWKQILITEAVILGLFLIMLFIRIGNPDLWHPSKGGEKPMDFSYFNAVLKSNTFPPYDPWFAGGYLNYYYYGFVIVAVLVKWLGITPAVAYNLILPTLFSLLGIGAYTIVSEVVKHDQDSDHPLIKPFLYGLAGAVTITIAGNLGTVRMIWYGLQRLAAPDGNISGLGVTIFTRLWWTVLGFIQLFRGNKLPFYPGDWYWIPSRAIPAPHDVEPITEFPFFTYLYADLHAHMIALPFAVLVLALLVNLLFIKGDWSHRSGSLKWTGFLAGIFVLAMTVGALRPTNTWDFPVYLLLSIICLVYIFVRYKPDLKIPFLNPIADRFPWLNPLIFIGGFVVLVIGLYEPYSYWYAAGYTSVERWLGDTTPFWSYLTHWGFFLFFITCWLARESYLWMSSTPLQSLASLRRWFGLIKVLIVIFIALIFLLILLHATIAWFVLPLAAWAGVLLLRPDQSDIKRFFLFLIGTSLVLTLFVEVIVLKGDIGRMNTVFKFYLQVWEMLSITSIVCLFWLLKDISIWKPNTADVFRYSAILLAFGVLLFPVMAGMDKVRDRYIDSAPHGLDGLQYMNGAVWVENDINTNTDYQIQLEQDYQGIRWMQQNVIGTPVIVEANTVEYRWGSRYTINTGLPGVVGWNWHQRQQRGVVSTEWVTQRVDQIGQFYSSMTTDEARSFLKKYNVKYIIVGQLEKAIYPAAGLQKFTINEGIYWKQVFQYKDTTIYEVIGG